MLRGSLGRTQPLRFNSRLTVPAERPSSRAICPGLSPIDSCVWIIVLSSMLNCLYIFPMQHFPPKMLHLVFERAQLNLFRTKPLVGYNGYTQTYIHKGESMNLHIAKWGNSLAVRIPMEYIRRTGLKEGDTAQASLTADGAMMIRAEAWDRKAFTAKLSKTRQSMK